jgi:ribosomal protein S18 acetylase RimI-like enzyme
MNRNESRCEIALSYRELDPLDIDAMVALDRRCFPPSQAYDAIVFDYLFQFPRVARGAFDGRVLAGFVFATWNRRHAGHVVTIDVEASHRRLGLGTSLMEQTEAELLRQGARKIFLQVDRKNHPAVAFYLHLGFDVCRELPNYYGRGRDGLLMVREIGTPGI